MSVDTSHVRPISPLSVEGTLSAWDTLRMHLDAERAVKAAALRREIGPTPPMTAAELRMWIAKYDVWLGTEYVQTRGALKDWVQQQKANALRQLAQLTAGGAK